MFGLRTARFRKKRELRDLKKHGHKSSLEVGRPGQAGEYARRA
ncbi:Uncharacterised protein [Burkholderia cepacia]|nr:hypothetical protein DM41_7257 [Burkholderia cepacia ATCC 25416]SPU89813.1 Uncharacterised protein [Burkholderia cepacia]